MESGSKENGSGVPEVKKTKISQRSEDGASCEEPPKGEGKLSKKQLKKIRRREEWLAKLPERRARERNRMKLKRKEAREKEMKTGPTRKELKSSKMSDSKNNVSLVLDFSFDDLMTQRDISKCINQLLRCYSVNRRSDKPARLYAVNFGGLSKKEIAKHKGYENWDVNFQSESYLDLFDKDNVVYLTSESENVIQDVEEGKAYVIGALVDHNAHKGLCHNIAVSQGIKHGRLPIDEYLEMKTRKVLAVNHVFQIMLFVSNGMSWKDALMETLPRRKGAVLKEE